jgi:type II secretory pathway pseudopilin PulG
MVYVAAAMALVAIVALVLWRRTAIKLGEEQHARRAAEEALEAYKSAQNELGPLPGDDDAQSAWVHQSPDD